MYFYSLDGYEEQTIIQHKNKFSTEEFHKMCKEAPMYGEEDMKYCSSLEIEDYLKEKYGFEELNTTASFFID